MAATGLVAADQADGDMQHHLMQVPYDLDPHLHIYWRVLWSSESTTAADTTDWILTFTSIVPGTTVLVTPVTAISNVIPLLSAYGSTATDIPVYTGFGSMNPDQLTEDVEFLSLRVEMDGNVGLAERINFLGLEMTYTPRRLKGPDGMLHNAKRMTTVLGKVTAN